MPRVIFFQDDPVYLCGLYETKLKIIKAILSTEDSDYVSPYTLKLIKKLLEINETEEEKRQEQLPDTSEGSL
jgi:hypothetical protein